MKPLLRGIEAFPAEYEKKKGLILRDNFIGPEKNVFIPLESAFILSLLNGKNTPADIQQIIMKQTGNFIETDKINQLIKILDNHFFLDNQAYREKIKQIKDEYKKEKIRTSVIFKDIEDKKNKITKFFYEIFSTAQVDKIPAELKAIIAPHIDYDRGKNAYAKVYKILSQVKKAKTYIILGVNHFYDTDMPFILTDKIFQTPFGDIPTDSDFIKYLKDNLSFDILEEEIAHKREHSVEMQAILLKYIFYQEDIKILPVLCNFLDLKDKRIEEFIEKIRAYIKDKDIVIIAGCDFSHMGTFFGDEKKIEKSGLENIEKYDRELIQNIIEQQPDEFYKKVFENNNKNKVCSYSTIYTLLKILQEYKAELISYNQAYNPENTVTFASLIFE